MEETPAKFLGHAEGKAGHGLDSTALLDSWETNTVHQSHKSERSEEGGQRA